MTRAEIEARLEAISPGGFFADHKRVEILTTELRALCTALLESMDRVEELERYARDISKAAVQVRPLGGSELFIGVGSEYYADPALVGNEITRIRDALHEASLPKSAPANPSEATMSVKDDGGPASPVLGLDRYTIQRDYLGLTIRDWFAGQAISGLLANGDGPNSKWFDHPPSAARWAYDLADAMLAARTGGKE